MPDPDDTQTPQGEIPPSGSPPAPQPPCGGATSPAPTTPSFMTRSINAGWVVVAKQDDPRGSEYGYYEAEYCIDDSIIVRKIEVGPPPSDDPTGPDGELHRFTMLFKDIDNFMRWSRDKWGLKG